MLCNNAGIANDRDFLEPLDEVWEQQWGVNVMSHVYAVRAVLPEMLERGEGDIQQTASMAGILTSHGAAAYAATKHAVVGPGRVAVDHLPRARASVCSCSPRSGWTRRCSARPRHSPARPPGRSARPRRSPARSSTPSRGALPDPDRPGGPGVDGRKTDDLERWLRGMRRLQTRLDSAER